MEEIISKRQDSSIQELSQQYSDTVLQSLMENGWTQNQVYPMRHTLFADLNTSSMTQYTIRKTMISNKKIIPSVLFVRVGLKKCQSKLTKSYNSGFNAVVVDS